MTNRLPVVSIVTVNYNHGAYLANYIESLAQSAYPIAEVIIVDNNSTDNSKEILRQYPHVTVIYNQENIGYSSALNQAFQAATSPLVCATGPDVVFDTNWLRPLVDQYLEDPTSIFAVASRVLSLDKTEIQSTGGSLHYSGHLCVFNMWKPVDLEIDVQPAPHEVGAIDSTSVLIDREKFLNIGGCDPMFFVYHEEFDYCYRARMRAWTCWYHPQSIVYHGDGSKEFSVRGKGEYPRLRPYLHTRNRLLSVFKNYQVRTLIGILPALLVLELLNVFMLARMGLHRSYFDAILWLWRHRKEVILKRYAIQRHRVLQDRMLLQSDALTITPLLLHSKSFRVMKYLLDVLLALYWKIAREILYP